MTVILHGVNHLISKSMNQKIRIKNYPLRCMIKTEDQNIMGILVSP